MFSSQGEAVQDGGRKHQGIPPYCFVSTEKKKKKKFPREHTESISIFLALICALFFIISPLTNLPLKHFYIIQLVE